MELHRVHQIPGATDQGSAVNGLTFSNSTNTSTNFAINDAAAGDFLAYALGIKDGSDPKWGVFLLSLQAGGLSGVASMTGGSFSHFALFGTNTPGLPTPQLTTVPEPASLTLLGSGLLLMASKARKRLKNRS